MNLRLKSHVFSLTPFDELRALVVVVNRQRRAAFRRGGRGYRASRSRPYRRQPDWLDSHNRGF